MKKVPFFTCLVMTCLLLLFSNSCNVTCDCENSSKTVFPGDSQDFSLEAPADLKVFTTNLQKPFTFKWTEFTHNSFDHYRLRIFIMSKKGEADSTLALEPVYESQLSENQAEWPEKLEWPADLGEAQQLYIWNVAAEDKAGNILFITAKRSFYFNNDSFLFTYDHTDIVCLYIEGPYDCYNITDYWNFLSSGSVNLNGLPIEVLANSNPIPIIPPPTISGPNVTVNPINSATLVYQVCVPHGTPNITTTAAYQDQNPPYSIQYQTYTITLPPCVCTLCDQWTIDVSSPNFPSSNTNNIPFINTAAWNDYVYLNAKLTVNPDPAGWDNIIKVVAEIVDFEEICASDCQCETCNTFNSQHGVFVPYFDGTNFITNWLEGTGWANNNPLGTLVHNREHSWVSSGPAGVDMRGGLMNYLTIGLPKFSNLRDCCCDKYKVCIRYTFTSYDVDSSKCVSCSRNICYTIVRTSSMPISQEPQVSYDNFMKSPAEINSATLHKEFVKDLRKK